MTVDGRHPAPSFRLVPDRTGDASRQRLEVLDDSLVPIGITRGAHLPVDRDRRARNGDVVWVELVRRGSTVRLLRRFARQEGVVTLAALVEGEPAIMRQEGELLILGVVDLPDVDLAPEAASKP